MTRQQRVSSAKSVGRIVGLLFLAQVLLAPPVYTEFGMMRSVITPGFLANAAGNAMQIRVAVLLTLVLSALTLAAALIAMPVFRKHGYRFSYLMIMPTALTQLALTLWLIVRGFEERQHLLRGEAERVELAGA